MTLGAVVLVVSVAPVELVATPDEINGSSSAYNPTYEYTHYTSICINYRMYSIRTYVYQVYIHTDFCCRLDAGRLGNSKPFA